jgi:hypothetical protein
MDWVVVEGVKPWDGRYELPLDEFKLRNFEWGWIRRWTGYFPADVLNAMKGADAELLVALAVIALYRAGKVTREDVGGMFQRFEEENFGSFTLSSDDAEVEALDPPRPASSNGSETLSGGGSRTDSVSPETIPPATGSPVSATSVSVATRSPT